MSKDAAQEMVVVHSFHSLNCKKVNDHALFTRILVPTFDHEVLNPHHSGYFQII